SLAVFRKSDGARLAALRLNNLFSQAPTGTPCDDNNQDEPQVLYDPLADQWLVSDVAWSNFVSGTMYECMAVSISGDPLSGGWYFYAWPVESGGLWPADAALGVWPDGIYMSANVYSTTVNLPFQHVQAWAFNRTQMEAGATAQAVTFNLDKIVGGLEVRGLLPSTMHAVTGAPPAGRENLFASIWKAPSVRIW